MPFKSEKQRKYMYSKLPKIAKKWAKKYGSYKPAKKISRKKSRKMV